MRVLILVAAFFSAGVAAAAPTMPGELPIVFGQPLGKPIIYPECNNSISDYTHEKIYALDDKQVCFKKVADLDVNGTSIDFPAAKVPEMLSVESVFLHLIDGNVEGMYAGTLGHSSATGIVSQLSQKFGKPTAIGPRQAIIGGISLIETYAVWQGQGYRVEYESISGDLEHGELNIRSTRAVEEDDRKDRNRAEQRTQL